MGRWRARRGLATAMATAPQLLFPMATAALLVASLATGQVVHLEKDGFDFNEPIEARVDFGEGSQRGDFVGIYASSSSPPNEPLNLILSEQQGMAQKYTFKASRSGVMEIRAVRPFPRPNIIARKLINVFDRCPRDCFSNGVCVQGKCECEPHWAGRDCASLAKQGTSIEVEDPNADIEDAFQFGAPIIGKIAHRAIAEANIKVSPADFVGVWRQGAEHFHKALAKGKINGARFEVAAPEEAGNFVVRLFSVSQGEVVAESEPFNVARPCKNQCSMHGKCTLDPKDVFAGHCNCFAGYDLDDCSRKDGMVRLKVKNKDDVYSNDKLEMGFTRKTYMDILSQHDIVKVCLPKDEACLAPEAWGFAVADEEKCTDPDVPDSDEEVDMGTVSFGPYKLFPGTYVARYVRQDGHNYAESEPFTIYKTCRARCNAPRGTCVKGKCECTSLWKGEACERGNVGFDVSVDSSQALYTLGDIHVHWSKPTGVGSIYDWLGLYKSKSANTSVGLVDYAYSYDRPRPVNAEDNERTGKTILKTTTPGEYVVRYVGAFDLGVMAESAPFQVFAPCPNDCNGHGKCVEGLCECKPGFQMKDCSRQEGRVELTIDADEPIVVQPPFTNMVVSIDAPFGHLAFGDFIAIYRGKEAVPGSARPIQYKLLTNDPSKGGTFKYRFTLPESMPAGVYRLSLVRAGPPLEEAVGKVFKVVVKEAAGGRTGAKAALDARVLAARPQPRAGVGRGGGGGNEKEDVVDQDGAKNQGTTPTPVQSDTRGSLLH